MDQDKIKQFNEEQKAKADKKAVEDAQRQLNKEVTESVRSGAKVTTSAILSASKKTTEELGQELRQSGEKVLNAMQESQDTIAGALNNLVLATVISKDPKVIETAKAFAGLLGEISKASDDFKGSKLNLLPVANEKLATSIDKLANKVVDKPDRDYTKDLDAIRQQISKLKLNVQPIVNVPENKLDIQPITDAVKELKIFVGKQKAPSVSVDMDSVVQGLKSVNDTIANLSFPVPNYVLPFKNTQGAATQVQLDTDGKMPISGTISVDTTGLATDSNQTDGSQKTQIVDAGGEVATVTGGKLDVNATASLAGDTLPVSGATEGVAVAIVDGSGNQITSFGGGVQYTEGDTDVSITGTAMMVEDASNTLQPAQGDKTNGLDVDVTRSALPTGAATSAKQDTGNTSLSTLAGAVAGSEMQVDVVTLPVAFNTGTRSATTQRVTIATDDSVPVTNAGLTELAAAINSSKVDVNIVSSDVASGGTAAADDADFTAGTTLATPVMGVYESSPTTVTDGDLGTVGITSGRRLKTSATVDAALPAGNNNIGDVDVASVIPGTGGTNLGKAVDAVAGATDTGIVPLAIRDDVLTTITPVDGDYAPLRVDSTGRQWVTHDALDDLGAGLVELTAFQGGSWSVSVSGVSTAANQSTQITAEQAIQTSVELIDDAIKTDDAAFTPATTKVMMAGFEYDDTSPDSVDEGDAGAARMSANRNIYTQIRDAAGNERGANVNASGQLAVTGPVTNAGTFAVQVDGSALTALQLIDDTVATLGTTTYSEATTKANVIGAVRRDANTTLVDTTNEIAPLQVNATGELKVAQIQALPAGTNAIGKLAANSGVVIGDVNVTTLPVAFNTGTRSATTQRVTIATDDVVAITANSSVNVAQMNGTAVTMGNGAAGTGVQRVTIASDSTGQVALAAGTNGIGKLTANSGVDIGDVDVTSAVTGTLDHGSNQDIDTAAEQITATSFACKFGVTLRAPSDNTSTLWIGNSDVTVGGTAATDGIPLYPGDSLFLPVSNSNIPYAIASANNQKIYWIAA